MAANALIAVIGLAGCERSIDVRQGVTAVRPPIAPVPTAVPQVQDSSQRQQQVQSHGLEQLQAELVALQSEQGALQLERDRLTNQIESHQAEGEKRLAEIKAQWSALNNKAGVNAGDATARERFSERARVEMESALMMDQEYRAHLEETDTKLRETQQKMRALQKEQANTDAVTASE